MLTPPDSHLHHHHGHRTALTVHLQTDNKQHHRCVNGTPNTHVLQEVSNLNYGIRLQVSQMPPFNSS